MGFRDELAASKARIRQLEEENAELREAAEERPEPAPDEAGIRRGTPTAAEYVAAAFITATAGVAFYASIIWWLPLTQPESAGEAPVAGVVGGLASAGTALVFLCPAILGWKRSDGAWLRASRKERWTAAASGLAVIVFLALLFLFTEGNGF